MLAALSNFKCNFPNGLSGARRSVLRGHAGHLDEAFRLASRIIDRSDQLQRNSDAELRQAAQRLRHELSRGVDPAKRLTEAFALVRESARRVHGHAHYEVQLVTAILLFEGQIVEMQTGEGKTLAALPAAFLRASVGKGCHVVTANDYLARRDATYAAQVLGRLGMNVGSLDEQLPREQRPAVYQQEITYGTAREFGFDFLKDRLSESSTDGNSRSRASRLVVQRGHYFAIVDEADSVMIDDARTPLLIAAPREGWELTQHLAIRCQQVVGFLNPNLDFQINHQQRTATLTRRGCATTLRCLDGEFVRAWGPAEVYQALENALAASYLFQRDQHYIVANDQVAIVDESTGRVAEGRQWQDGLHQAIEAKEGVPITAGTSTLAKISVQTYFRQYQHLSGLTGTAAAVVDEFKTAYQLPVTIVPTRKPSVRRELPCRIFSTYLEKAIAVAESVRQRIAQGQSVLIGTPSVVASERISSVLTRFGIEHEVLNCIHHQRESELIAAAGGAGHVTVATNMAGRGTDIGLSSDVLAAGGLHIIATEFHASSRIDRQFIGRCARQGQPGSFQFLLSLEDELLVHSQPISEQAGPQHRAGELPIRWLKLFQRAQAEVERRHARQRLSLLESEHRREKLCRQIGLNPYLEMFPDGM